MGKAIEIITGLATAPAATLAAVTALTGNSFVVRDSRKGARMLSRWDTRQGAGTTRITSPRLHDSTIGMQHGSAVGQSVEMIWIPQELHAQDNLTVSMTGSATAGDIEHTSFIIEYDDLAGVEARFLTGAQIAKRVVNRLDTQITIATGTDGQYTGAAAISSAQDAFKANTDYALLGFTNLGAACHSINIYGPDLGNLRVGAPGAQTINNTENATFFLALDRCPVINSANKALTFLDAVVNENGGDPIVIAHWVQLK